MSYICMSILFLLFFFFCCCCCFHLFSFSAHVYAHTQVIVLSMYRFSLMLSTGSHNACIILLSCNLHARLCLCCRRYRHPWCCHRHPNGGVPFETLPTETQRFGPNDLFIPFCLVMGTVVLLNLICVCYGVTDKSVCMIFFLGKLC